MSKGKVAQYMHEEAEEDGEEFHDPKPYKHPQTAEEKRINRLTGIIYRRNQETKSLKQCYDAVKQERDNMANHWAEAVNENIKLREKHRQFRSDVQEFMYKVNKLKASLDALLAQSKYIQEEYKLEVYSDPSKKHEESCNQQAEEEEEEIDLGYEEEANE